MYMSVLLRCPNNPLRNYSDVLVAAFEAFSLEIKLK